MEKNEENYFSKQLSNFTSYSQFLEDLILFSVFYDVENGFYIDIGANDPNVISVTKNLYIRGWYGINIEPLPNKYQALVKFRERDINLQIGAGKMKKKGILYVMGSGSTLQKKKNTKAISINIDTMSNICRKYVPKKEIIQFCKIDVEGEEKNVLLGYDFENYRPKVFCIESTLPGTSIPCHNLWEEILLKNDYSFAYQYRINRYYIDNRIKGLRERFFQAEKSVEKYNKLKDHK
jgi:FkbM family methyltransferase